MNTPLSPDDICRFITGRLAAGPVPWQAHPPGLPEHALTGVPFTGINVLLLWQAMQQRSLHSGRWLTGDDLRRLGGRVRDGEKPVTLVRYRPVMSLFKVINLGQCDGLEAALQPDWPLPPRPQPSPGIVRGLVQTGGVPLVHRDNVLPVYRPLHDRMELPPLTAYASEQAYWQDVLTLLVRATGHPQRLHRFGLTVDTRTDEQREALVAELGAAFLAASLGLAGLPAERHEAAPSGATPWHAGSDDDPWRLFRAAEAARRAADWLVRRRPAMPEVERWRQMALTLLSRHYGQAPDDTLLGCLPVAQQHLDAGTTPRMAVNALARIYHWARCDLPQPSLWLNETGTDSELLALSAVSPELLTYHRIPGTPDADGEAAVTPPGMPAPLSQLPLLPACGTAKEAGAADAANDDGPDDPDGNDNVVALPWADRRGKANPHVQRFTGLLNSIAPHEGRWQVFSDFVHMAACSLYNAVHRDEAFEADYLRRVARYAREDADNMARLLAEVVTGLEFSPTDFLGRVYMSAGLGNHHNGQYFTPYSVSYTMAKLTLSDRLSVLTSGERDFITVSDPACGAGGMIVALAEAMLEAGFNPQRQMVAYCVDIDPVPAMMCYIQLSLMGIPAIVATGNSLTVDIRREMATPAFVLGGWQHRWQADRTHKAA